MARHVSIPYGTDSIELSLPDSAAVLAPTAQMPPPFTADEVARALQEPIGTASLFDLIKTRNPKTVAMTISDITRAVPNRVFLPEILATVRRAGVADTDVTIIIGTGLHRPSTREERAILVGDDILSRYRIVDHTAEDPTTLVQVSSEPYVAVNREFAQADFKIVTGFIEPHFMAGFSGGRKGVCPALVDLATIQRFHGFETLSDPNAKEGVLEGNPCHSIACEVARRVQVDFLFNVAINRDKEIVGMYCGDLEAAHEQGCADVKRWTSAEIPRTYDVVVTSGGGYPLDTNFYQTVKGMCLALPALHDTSKLLIASSCPEQLGSPEYTELMKRYSGRWQAFPADARRTADHTEKDQWELQMQCRVLSRVGTEGILFFSDGLDPELQRQANVTPVLGPQPVSDRIQHALDQIIAERPDASVAVIPDGPYTMLVNPE